MKSSYLALSEIDSEWASRCTYWPAQSKPSGPRQRGAPIILCGHGLSLSVDKGALLVRDGLTHYPQQRVERRLFPGDPTRPRRILLIDGSGSISLAALDWLRMQDIALIRVDWSGAPSVVAASARYAADPATWRRQIAAHADPKRRLAIARHLIERKLTQSATTLNGRIPATPRRALALDVIAQKLAALRTGAAHCPSALHGIEGRAAKVYFDAWTGAPISWKAAKRYPVPDSWRAIGQRQSFATGKKGKNRDATHPLNAMLNYAYAVLESEIALDVLAHGFDPSLGFLHSGYRGSPALVLDLMEPMRPVIDAAVLKFVLDETFSGADFMLRADGVCRLNPQLARRIAQIAMDACAKSDRGVAALSL